MKKIIKALAITATAAAMCVGIGAAAGCANKEETYVGEYHYIGAHSPAPYGIVVEVTVKNNIITGIKEITNTEAAKSYQTYKDVVDGKEATEATYHAFTPVSAGWETTLQGKTDQELIAYTYWAYEGVDFSGMTDAQKVKYVKEHPVSYYGWTDGNAKEWTDHTSWLLDQYIGWSVADVLDVSVYTAYGYKLVTVDGAVTQAVDVGTKGEPYKVAYNTELNDSGLLISGATQGSGRLLLAVQDALSK